MGEKLPHKLIKYNNSCQHSSLSNNVYLYDRNETNISKYFKPSTVIMDESFSDFQAPKKIVRTVKRKQLTKTTKAKLKKCKGQKDIRKVLDLNNKKNDLVTYTKDFDKVCTNLGIDVNPEQLELAVALSSSLAEYKDENFESDSSVCNFQTSDVKSCLTQTSRITKIKSTLEEYGFKLKLNHVPISFNSKKWKGKRYIKYDLLNRTKEDKAQMIADKYSQILFDGLLNTQCDKQYVKNSSNVSPCLEEFCKFNAGIYNKSNYTFVDCENDSLYFYTNNLVEISSYKIGCLLRDWCAIPGRPQSPVRNWAIPNFYTPHIMQDQNGLDKLLSGTVDICRNLIQPFLNTDKIDMGAIEINNESSKKANVLNEIRSIDIRSNSPDIFDEESQEVIESSNNKIEHNSEDEFPAIELNVSKQKFSYKKSNAYDDIYLETEAMINFGKEKQDLYMPNSEHIDFVDISQNSHNSDISELKTHNMLVSEDKLDQNKGEDKNTILDSIDLTQNSNYGTQDFILRYNDHNSRSLSSEAVDPELKKSNDELFDSILMKTISKSMESISSNNYDIVMIKPNSETENLIAVKSPIKYNSQSSVNSEVFEISDEEVNYSMNCGQLDEGITKNSKYNTNSDKDEIYKKSDNFDLYGSSLFDQIPTNFSTVQHSTREENGDSYDSKRESDLPNVDMGHRENKTQTETQIHQIVTPVRTKSLNETSITDMPKTPSNTEYIIKTKNVTPMLDYKMLSTPERNNELSKYGLKPLKRKRAIQLLEHVYYQTHPLIEDCNTFLQENDNVTKIRKLSSITKANCSSSKFDLSCVENVPFKSTTHETEAENILRNDKNEKRSDKLDAVEEMTKINIYEETDNTPVIKNLPSDAFEWIFQKKEKTKVQGCRVPLHIVFHNYVSARSYLMEAILRYEPVRIDIIHKQLVKEGFRYDSKDLLKFLDKKCITVKTLDKSQYSSRRKIQRTPIKRNITRDII